MLMRSTFWIVSANSSRPTLWTSKISIIASPVDAWRGHTHASAWKNVSHYLMSNACYSTKGTHCSSKEVHLAGNQIENAFELSRGVLLRFRLPVGGSSHQREKSWLSPLCSDRASRILSIERALLLLHSSRDVQGRYARGVQGWW